MSNDDRALGLRIRFVREQQKRSIKEIAATTGLTSSLISQFERGITGISLNSLRRIAGALNLPIASLFSEIDMQVVRHHERIRTTSPHQTAAFTLVSPDTLPVRIIECRLAPGQQSAAAPIWHPGQECAVIVKGQVTATVADQSFGLEEGDSVTLNCGQPHMYANAGQEEAVILIVMDARG